MFWAKWHSDLVVTYEDRGLNLGPLEWRGHVLPVLVSVLCDYCGLIMHSKSMQRLHVISLFSVPTEAY